MADGLTLMSSNLHKVEAFPMPGGLIHTRITWALSSTATQVLGVIMGPTYAHGGLGTVALLGHPLSMELKNITQAHR